MGQAGTHRFRAGFELELAPVWNLDLGACEVEFPSQSRNHGFGRDLRGGFNKKLPLQPFLWRSHRHKTQLKNSMILARLLHGPIRFGLNASAARTEKHWEKAAFNTATVFAIFGIGVSTMGLTQLALTSSKIH